MEFREKLQTIRKSKKLSQEEVAETLNVSRQAVAKWESGQAFPDIENLIILSDFFKVTIDNLVKDNSDCSIKLIAKKEPEFDEAITFLCEAKKKTYASNGNEIKPSLRMNSHDLIYNKGKYAYVDTYFGGEKFIGEEAIWLEETPIWAMNYSGRVVSEQFSGDFLKEALFLVNEESPFRGPALYKNGDYVYNCSVDGDFTWFQGNEKIFYNSTLVYECCFHGGIILS